MAYYSHRIIAMTMPKVLNKKLHYFLLSLTIFLYGCHQTHSTAWPFSTQQIIEGAYHQGFQQQRYHTPFFILTSFEKLSSSSPILHIYIEGDGNSWKSRYLLSNDPTPHQPLALQLAQQDPHSDIVYLARPCQYTPHTIDKHCTSRYWSSHRYAPEVIQAIHEALDQIKQKTHCSQFILIGFSGGACVAALVAAQRYDILCLFTIAGDLNPSALSRYHHTTPLFASLNPMDIAPYLHALPQYHLSGKRDNIVPPWVAQSFSEKTGNPTNKLYIFSDIEHHKGWLEQAPEIHRLIQQCHFL